MLVNLEESWVCELATYPGANGGQVHGPYILQYTSNGEKVIACGSTYSTEAKACHDLSAGSSSWHDDVPSMQRPHCPYTIATSSHYLNSVGLFVIGQDACFTSESKISTELLAGGQWQETNTASPYGDSFPSRYCSAQLNASHIIITGGQINSDFLGSAWILDVSNGNYAWTQAKAMISTRYNHGCTATAPGEILIAGGGSNNDKTVHIYDPANDAWRQEQDLPDEMDNYANPVLLIWKDKVLLLETKSARIWERDDESGSWHKMGTTLGAQFLGDYDTAITVPAGSYQCP